MAGSGICANKWVRLGSREDGHSGPVWHRMLNMWLGRVWTCLWRASMFSTLV